jgi:hypothetical protein
VFNALSSIKLLQEEGMCNEFISLLVIGRWRSTCAKLMPLQVTAIEDIARRFERVIDEFIHNLDNYAMWPELLGSYLRQSAISLATHCVYPLDDVELEIPHVSSFPSELYGDVKLWRIAVHVIDIAVLAYSGAHIEPFDSHYLALSDKSFTIPGPFLAEKEFSDVSRQEIGMNS